MSCFAPSISYSCWVPPFSQPKKQCATLSLTITPVVEEGTITYLFNLVNNGPMPAANVVLDVNFTGTIVVPPPGPQNWIIGPSAAAFTYGTVPIGISSVIPALQFSTDGSSSVTATITSSTSSCTGIPVTANAFFAPPQ